MAWSQELPHSFEEALKAVARILAFSQGLVARNLVGTEAEQIVIAAYRKSSGQSFSRIDFFTRIKDRYPNAAGEMAMTWATLRAEGRSLQHLLGFQSFLDHEYEVSSDVLIPRPETEILVSIMRQKLALGRTSLGLEVGLGSGVIALELLGSISGLAMIATEISPPAQAIAERNAEKILGPGKGRLQVRTPTAGQVLEPFFQAGTPRADFLVSNPPYLVGPDEVDEEVMRNEPGVALFAPPGDPLYFYRKISERAAELLNERGQVFLEIPHERSSEVAQLFQKTGWSIKVFPDLNGRPRVLFAVRL